MDVYLERAAQLASANPLEHTQSYAAGGSCGDMMETWVWSFQLMGKKSSSGYGWPLSKVEIDLETSPKQIDELLIN